MGISLERRPKKWAQFSLGASTPRMKIPASLFACVLIALSGCAEPSLAPSDADTTAKSLFTTPGKARIYVYRPSGFYGAGINLPTFLNTQLVGQPTVGTFLLLEVPPATYTLTSSNINSQEVSFSVHSGEAVFFLQPPGVCGGVKDDPISNAESLA